VRRAVMAAVLFVVGCVVGPVSPASAADLGDRLYAGEYLDAGDQLTSPTGAYVLRVQDDGNVVIYSRAGVPQWATGTRGTGNWFLLDETESLNVLSASDQVLWHGGRSSVSVSMVVLQDDGNLVIYDAVDGRPNWSRTTGSIYYPAPAPAPQWLGDRIGAGGGMTTNQYLSVGGWTAVLQRDDNFVVYANGVPQWSSNTGQRNPTGFTLRVQADGNVVLYSYYRWEWSTGSSGGPATLVLQADGNLVVYGGDGRARWSRTTGVIR